MDIHKPKPWHGIREFLKEYLIIVVGVLTALGAEAGVEWLHWNHLVGEARHELTLDQMRIIGRIGARQAASGCLARRLDELSGILDQAASTGRLPPLGEISGAGNVPWNLRSWSGIVSGGVLPHFPRDEADRLSAEVLYLDSVPARERDESQAWLELRAMIGPGRAISPAELVSLRAAVMAAYRQAANIRNNVDQIAELVRDTHLLSQKQLEKSWRYGVSQNAGRTICAPIPERPGDPYAAFRKRAAAPPELPKRSYDDPNAPYASRGFRRD